MRLLLLLLQALTEKVLFRVLFQDPVMFFFAARLVAIKEWLKDSFLVVDHPLLT
jgi:hypothetical protein